MKKLSARVFTGVALALITNEAFARIGTPAPGVLSIATVDGGIEITISGTQDVPYRLQRTTDLSNTNSWITISTNLTDFVGHASYVDTHPPATNTFYRAFHLE